MKVETYHSLSDTTMEALLDSLETLIDDVDNTEYEVDYHSGVLTLNLGDKGTYVINKQPPNQQIWLSSPFSGPKRYDYSPDHDDWLYSRDNVAMGQLLNAELTKALGRPVDLGINSISALAS
ncbi:Frataxin [Pluteus cervinus]|uniref:Frataxin n=1 Tax=Pluteus cervinus TaxID=181527 RepID=A0ACD3BFI5_9AGAR|nr:Frataxin [Pluteus cervinus]